MQTDKTKESIQEIKKEYQQEITNKPITKEEFERTKRNVSMQLPGKRETTAAILRSLKEMMMHDLPNDYFKNYGKI